MGRRVLTWRVSAASPTWSDVRANSLCCANVFELARGGRGQAVSIIGDAGLGKSRLLYECRQALANRDCAWLDGRCHPYGAALAYGPIVELLKQHFQIDTSDREEDIRDKVQHGLASLAPP